MFREASHNAHFSKLLVPEECEHLTHYVPKRKSEMVWPLSLITYRYYRMFTCRQFETKCPIVFSESNGMQDFIVKQILIDEKCFQPLLKWAKQIWLLLVQPTWFTFVTLSLSLTGKIADSFNPLSYDWVITIAINTMLSFWNLFIKSSFSWSRGYFCFL